MIFKRSQIIQLSSILVGLTLIVAFNTYLALNASSKSGTAIRNVRVLAQANHANSNALAVSIGNEVDKVNCGRTIVTRKGLITFFNNAAYRSVEREKLDKGFALKLDHQAITASRLAAKQEANAGCDGKFPDGGSG